jgi:hypothetical protein
MDRENTKKHVGELVNLYCEAKYKSVKWDIVDLNNTFVLLKE